MCSSTRVMVGQISGGGSFQSEMDSQVGIYRSVNGILTGLRDLSGFSVNMISSFK